MEDKAAEPGTRLLLVDDDAELCELVSEYLTARGLVVETEGDGGRGLERARQGHYDLMVLDVMLPGLDGFEILRRLRAGGGAAAKLPVVMLTAHGDEVDRIVGLELGADDYLPKPFNPRELLARIRAILRRVNTELAAAHGPTPNAPQAALARLHVGDVEMDVGARTVRRAGETLDLTAAEFDLLHALLRAAGQVVTREKLAREVLDRRLLPFDRSLDMHMSKLRRKLSPPESNAERIKTVRGVGYIYVTQDSS
ncbi:MAG: response regulator transcription factor [Armatimonadota bacterium]|nr:response regulator transcription factor [Armatimonadota bacterium]